MHTPFCRLPRRHAHASPIVVVPGRDGSFGAIPADEIDRDEVPVIVSGIRSLRVMPLASLSKNTAATRFLLQSLRGWLDWAREW